MSMQLDLECEDEAGGGKLREPRLEAGSIVITGGTALALWIRYLRKERKKELTKELAKELKLAETIADWDFHPTRTTDPNFFFGDEACSLSVDDKRRKINKDENGGWLSETNRVRDPDIEDHEERQEEYSVDRVILRDIVAELFPDECTTDPNEGCALVDYGYKPPQETDFEGPIIEKLRLHKKEEPEKLTFPLPSSIGNSNARRPARDVVTLLHPEITIVTHLQTLSISNFLKETRQKTKRRATRLKCFYELYEYPGFKVKHDKVSIGGNVRDALKRFVDSSFCQIVTSDEEDAIKKLYADTEKFLEQFGGEVSFAPSGF